MGRSFFGRTDIELYGASPEFARQISASPESFGLSPDDAAVYQSLNDIYVESYMVANAPGTRTKATIIEKNEARAQLRATASSLARRINATPTVTAGQKASLGLSVPGAPTAVGELGKPEQCKFTLQGMGALKLNWKCTNRRATGTVYLISRQIQSIAGQATAGTVAGEMKFLGVSRKRWFIDLTLPAGASEMIYQIQPVRSTAVGPAATFNITFGVAAGHAIPAAMLRSMPQLAA